MRKPNYGVERDAKLGLIFQRFGTGAASNADLEAIGVETGHPWSAGMTRDHGKSDTPGHLLEWIGGPDGPRTHRRLTLCGLHYAVDALYAAELGMTFDDFVVAEARKILNRREAAKRLGKG